MLSIKQLIDSSGMTQNLNNAGICALNAVEPLKTVVFLLKFPSRIQLRKCVCQNCITCSFITIYVKLGAYLTET